MIVAIQTPTLSSGMYSAIPSSSVSIFKLQNHITRRIQTWIVTAQVAMCTPSWARPCGAPFLLGDLERAHPGLDDEDREPRAELHRRAASIAFCTVLNPGVSTLNCFRAMKIQRSPQATKSCTVRLIPHCTVG